MTQIELQLKKEFDLKDFQVTNTIQLIDEGNTIPFIARYRKERTGELDDQVLRRFFDRLTYLRNLEERKDEITRLIAEQEKLTPELEEQIRKAETLGELEDIYRPYRPKRRTRATVAKEKGLEPLAEIIFEQNITDGSFETKAGEFISEDKGVTTIEEAISGAMDIIAENISDNAEFRKQIRIKTMQNGLLVSKGATEEDSVYRLYYDFSEPLSKIANHRLLAINRGEKEEILKVSVSMDEEIIHTYLFGELLKKPASVTSEYVEEAAKDAYKRLIAPSIENEIRADLTDRAGEEAIKLFSANLHSLLLQPPIKGCIVLGLDPAYRTGCKIAVVDETGKVLATTVIYCTLEHHDKDQAKKVIKNLIEKYDVDLISIGNGTASKESEIFVADVISEMKRDVKYMVVNESGASVYSASKLGAEEFPDFDVALRSAVSIARRLQDPLAELVKIDPKSIGVGQYQHDMNQKRLSQALDGVVEDCVNSVGVDLNTASPSLLSHIAGINASIAKNIVTYREENGKFEDRKQLLKVSKLGQKAFEQCAGFLRIAGGKNPLDNTSVHPESYKAAEALAKDAGFSVADLNEHKQEFMEKVKSEGVSVLAEKLGIGVPTLRDIIEAMLKPGRDPRDELPLPMLRSDLLSIENLSVGMVLSGTVRNVIDFGAFVDIGVHQDGLVHVSQISNKFIKHPMEALSVGDVVKVKIIDLDVAKKRISLSIKEAQ